METKKSSRALALNTLSLAIGLSYGLQALAQDASPDNDKLDTVTVTAQKRKERLLDVPLAVTALSSEALENHGVEGPSALTGLVPNLDMAPSPVSSLIASVGMRGMSSDQPSIWADPAVGMYVDGVFIGKSMGGLLDVVDIEQLEVLRGPQGTLFGRNTEAGAMNFITKKPSGEFDGSASLELGDYNRRVERISLDLPKMGGVSALVSLRNETQDGFIANPDGSAWGSKDRQAGRLALRIQPVSGLTVDYALDRTHIHETPPAGELLSNSGYGSLYPISTPIAQTAYLFQNPTCMAYSGNTCTYSIGGLAKGMAPYVNTSYPASITAPTTPVQPYERLDVIGDTLTAEYRLNHDNTIKYIGAWRNMVYDELTNYSGSPVPIFNGWRSSNYTTQSHELQWIGNKGDLRYVGGLYYFTDYGTEHEPTEGTLFTFTPGVIGYNSVNFAITSKASAIYGQLDYDINSLWTATLGGRYTKETKTVSVWSYNTDQNFNQGSNPYTVNGAAAASFEKFTPTFNLMYRISPDTNVFGRVAEGFRSGGFPAEAPIAAGYSPFTPFKPESSTSYELGLKTAFLHNKGQLSTNLFYTDVSNYQVGILPPGTIAPTIVNVGKMRSQGIEIDAAYKISSGVKVSGSYGYLDAKFLQFIAPGVNGAPVDAASNTVGGGAPKQTFNFNIDARLAQFSSGMNLRALLDYRYVADRYALPAQINVNAPNASIGPTAAESLLPATSTLNLRMILGNIKVGGPGDAEAVFWVKNLTDQHTLVSRMDLSGLYQMGYWSDPRTLGVTLNYRW